MWQPDRPHNKLPSLPPGKDIESKKVLKACIRARASLARIKEGSHLLPNPSILINIIPILEAQASSRIENIVTTADKLFLYAGHEAGADPITKEALRYRSALYEGYSLIQKKPLTADVMVQVCRIVKGITLDVRKTPGTKLLNDFTGETIYTPPDGEDTIRNMLHNLEKFIHECDEIDPLIRMAIMHYQFEAIHPFVDGNGRTGRILNILFLIQEGLLELPTLFLSGYIIRSRAKYYELLLGVTQSGNWEDWICYMLEGIEKTCDWTMLQIKEIRKLLETTKNQIHAKAPQIYSRELVDAIFIQPYCRIPNLLNLGLGHRQTVSKILKRLCDIDILTEHKIGREKIFTNTRLMALLTNPTKNWKS